MREYFSHKKKISGVSEFTLLIKELCESKEETYCSGGNSKDKRTYLYRGVSKERYSRKNVGFIDNTDLHESKYEMHKDVMRVFPKIFLHDTKVVDKLIRVQQYGIPARLIDVTYNPLVALFFAAGGFKAAKEGEKEEDGRVIFFGCEPESIIFSDDKKLCSETDLEQTIDYDDFVHALDVFRKFLAACKSINNISDSDFKNSLNELIGDIRRTFNSVITDFINIYAAICCMELLVDNLWKAFLDEDSANGLKEEEREFYDSLMKAYSECVSEYIRKTAGKLKIDIDASRYNSLASFLGDFCNFFFVRPKTSNELIERQQGASLLHPSVTHAFNLDDFNLQKISGFTVKSIIVDNGSKSNILKELKECGVTFSYLFPGLVNYPQNSYMKYSLKK